MKINLLLFLLSLLLFTPLQAQWVTKRITHSGLNRDYMVYLPNNYTAANPASLIVTLHGLGDTMENFKQIGFAPVADTTNYIAVVPQAVADIIAGTAWNSGAGILGYYPNSNVDDKGFLNVLIDKMQLDYSINPERIYMCGYSMGGFMTQRMACEANDKLTAVASVAGTLGSAITSCRPGRDIPVAHFHGTDDATVGYYNNTFGNSVDELITSWVQNNNVNPIPEYSALPNTMNDGYTVDHYLYSEGNADVELFKVNGANHVWLKKPANDIDYAQEIIRFFNKTQQPLGIENLEYTSVLIYPNPTRDEIFIQTGNSQSVEVTFFDTLHRKIVNITATPETAISLKSLRLQSGLYLMAIQSKTGTSTHKIIIN